MFLEIFGVAFGFLYLFLEIKKLKGMWLVGVLMAAVYAVVYWQQEVYATMGFQIYYLLVSVYGFIQWKRDESVAASESFRYDNENETGAEKIEGNIVYRKLSGRVLLLSILVYAFATAFMMLVLNKFTADPMPFADSSITVVSAIATFWLSKSYREQWPAWLMVNSLTVFMCVKIGLYPTAVLYFVNASLIVLANT